MKSETYNRDCLEAMREMPDNAFSLAIVDPPYGIGASNVKRGGRKDGKSMAISRDYGNKRWDSQSPDKSYFNELFRVSQNQIIWGANHFISKMPYDSPCWIVWDKVTGNNGYADCELAWASFDLAVRQFTFMWKGMFQGDMREKEERFHPTQKPVKLYKWLLDKYAKQGDKILDTHLGSGSSRIACYDYGFDFTGFELDKDYFEAQEKRFANHIAQPKLFEPTPTVAIQEPMFA